MRKYKFRGRSLIDGHWVYGSLAELYGTFQIFQLDDIDPRPYNNQYRKIPIEQDSVGQFVGFDNKNLRPIYEGDIVSFRFVFRKRLQKEVHYGTIEFYQKDNAYCIHEPDVGRFFFHGRIGDIAVVGNIYDNEDFFMKNVKIAKQ